MDEQHDKYEDRGQGGELDRFLESFQPLAHGHVDERPRCHHRPVYVPLDPSVRVDVRRYVERVLEPVKFICFNQYCFYTKKGAKYISSKQTF